MQGMDMNIAGFSTCASHHRVEPIWLHAVSSHTGRRGKKWPQDQMRTIEVGRPHGFCKGRADLGLDSAGETSNLLQLLHQQTSPSFITTMTVTRTENLITTALNSLIQAAEVCQFIGTNDKLPQTFASIGKYVTLAHQILQGVLDQLQAGQLHPDVQELFSILKSTKDAAVHLSRMCQIIAKTDEAQNQISDRYADFQQNKDDGIHVYLYRLLQGPRRLIDEGIIAATADQSHGLQEALDELSPLQPSPPATGGGIVHGGTGDLFNNAWEGRQYVSKDNAMQNIAHQVTVDRERQRQ